MARQGRGLTCSTVSSMMPTDSWQDRVGGLENLQFHCLGICELQSKRQMDSNQESIFTLVVIILNIYRDTSDAVLPRFSTPRCCCCCCHALKDEYH